MHNFAEKQLRERCRPEKRGHVLEIFVSMDESIEHRLESLLGIIELIVEYDKGWCRVGAGLRGVQHNFVDRWVLPADAILAPIT